MASRASFTTSTGTLFTFRQGPVVARMLASGGVDAAALVKQAGLSVDALSGDVTAPLARVQKLLDLSADKLRAPLFGLDLAELVPSGAFGAPEFVVRGAPSLQRGIEAFTELAPVVNPILRMSLVVDEREGRLTFTAGAARDVLGRHLNEFTVAVFVKQASQLIEQPMKLERAWFAHARSSKHEEEEVAARLACDVAFDAPDCGFAISRPLLARAPRTADPPLFEYMMTQARKQRDLLASSSDVVAQVMRTIESRLIAGDDVTLAHVAPAMGMTARSLQRHLGDAGITFREVLARVRERKRAELLRSGVAEDEVARRLGFADVRAMHRSLSIDVEKQR